MAGKDESRLLKRKSTSRIRSPWLRNVLSSLGGQMKDTGASLVPNFTAIVSETDKEVKAIAKAVGSGHVKKDMEQAFKNNGYVSLAQNILKNAAADLRSGNINNTKREDEAMNAAFGLDGTSDFDDDAMFGDFDLDDYDEAGSDSSSKEDLTDSYIQQQTGALQQSTKTATVAITSGIRQSIEAQLQGSTANVNAVLGAASTITTQINELSRSVLNSLHSQEASLSSMVEFNNSTMKDFIDKATAFMEKRGAASEEGDLFGNEAPQTKDSPFGIFSNTGTPNFSKYVDYIKSNLKKSISKESGSMGMVLSMLDPKSEMTQMLVANPIGLVSSMAMESAIPEVIKSTMTSVDKTLGSFFPALFMKIGQQAENSTNAFQRIIGKTLGFNSGAFTVNKEIDLSRSKLTGKGVVFDDVTKNSINNIIPKELFTQTSLLREIADKFNVDTKRADENAEAFDINTNRYIRRKDINDSIANTIVDAVNGAWSNLDISDALDEVVGNFKTASDQQMMNNIVREFKYLASMNPGFIDPTGRTDSKQLKNILKQIHAPQPMIDVLDNALLKSVNENRAMSLYQGILGGSNALNDIIEQISSNPANYNLHSSSFNKNKNVQAVLDEYFKGKQESGDTYYQIGKDESTLDSIMKKYEGDSKFKLYIESIRNKVDEQSSVTNKSLSDKEREAEIIRYLQEERSNSYGHKKRINRRTIDSLSNISTGHLVNESRPDETEESFSTRIMGDNGFIRLAGQRFNNVLNTIIFGNGGDVKKQLNRGVAELATVLGTTVNNKFIRPFVTTIFGESEQIIDKDGKLIGKRRADGVLSGIMNKSSDAIKRVKQLIDGKEYYDSDGKKHEGRGEDYSIIKSTNKMIRSILETTKTEIRGVLFGRQALDKNGNVKYEEIDEVDPKTGKHTKRKVPVKEGNGIVGSTLNFLRNKISGQTSEWSDRFFGNKTDENGNPIDKSKVQKDYKEAINRWMTDNLPDGIKGGVVGAAAGTMMGGVLGHLIGGPIVGTVLGSSIGIARKSEKFQSWLFGDEVTQKDGTVERIGGIISSKFQKVLKKSKNSAVAGATIGAIGGNTLLSLLPGNFGLLGSVIGGPLAGAGIGMATALFSRSNMFHEFLFGKKNASGDVLQTGVVDWWKQAWSSVKLFGDDEDEIKKAKASAGMKAAGAGLGFLSANVLQSMGFLPAFLGPAGPIGGALLGLAATVAHERGGIKKWLWGTKSDKDSPWVRVGLFGQFKNMLEANIIRPTADQATILMQNVAHAVQYEILDPIRQMIYPMTRLVKHSLKLGAKVVTGLGKATYNLLDKNGAFNKIFSGIASVAQKFTGGLIERTINTMLTPFRMAGKGAAAIGNFAAMLDMLITKDPDAYRTWRRERSNRRAEKKESKADIKRNARELKERQRNRKLIAKWTKNGAWEDTDENRAEAILQASRRGKKIDFYGEEGLDNSLERKRENAMARMSDDDIKTSDSKDPSMRSLRAQLRSADTLDEIKALLRSIIAAPGHAWNKARGRVSSDKTVASKILGKYSNDKMIQGMTPEEALDYLQRKRATIAKSGNKSELEEIDKVIHDVEQSVFDNSEDGELLGKYSTDRDLWDRSHGDLVDELEKRKNRALKDDDTEEAESLDSTIRRIRRKIAADEKIKNAKKNRKAAKSTERTEKTADAVNQQRYASYERTLRSVLRKKDSERKSKDYRVIYESVSAMLRMRPDRNPLSKDELIKLQAWMDKNNIEDFDTVSDPDANKTTLAERFMKSKFGRGLFKRRGVDVDDIFGEGNEGYARGTTNATAGWHPVAEAGRPEWVIDPKSKSVSMALPAGAKVIPIDSITEDDANKIAGSSKEDTKFVKSKISRLLSLMRLAKSGDKKAADRLEQINDSLDGTNDIINKSSNTSDKGINVIVSDFGDRAKRVIREIITGYSNEDPKMNIPNRNRSYSSSSQGRQGFGFNLSDIFSNLFNGGNDIDYPKEPTDGTYNNDRSYGSDIGDGNVSGNYANTGSGGRRSSGSLSGIGSLLSLPFKLGKGAFNGIKNIGNLVLQSGLLGKVGSKIGGGFSWLKGAAGGLLGKLGGSKVGGAAKGLFGKLASSKIGSAVTGLGSKLLGGAASTAGKGVLSGLAGKALGVLGGPIGKVLSFAPAILSGGKSLLSNIFGGGSSTSTSLVPSTVSNTLPSLGNLFGGTTSGGGLLSTIGSGISGIFGGNSGGGFLGNILGSLFGNDEEEPEETSIPLEDQEIPEEDEESSDAEDKVKRKGLLARFRDRMGAKEEVLGTDPDKEDATPTVLGARSSTQTVAVGRGDTNITSDAERQAKQGTYDYQMLKKAQEESERSKLDTQNATLRAILAGNLEQSKQRNEWSSVFGKKGIITLLLLFGIPALLKMIPGIGDLLSGLLTNIPAALAKTAEDASWHNENDTNTDGESSGDAANKLIDDVSGLTSGDISSFITGSDKEWDFQSSDRASMLFNIAKTPVHKVSKGISNLQNLTGSAGKAAANATAKESVWTRLKNKFFTKSSTETASDMASTAALGIASKNTTANAVTGITDEAIDAAIKNASKNTLSDATVDITQSKANKKILEKVSGVVKSGLESLIEKVTSKLGTTGIKASAGPLINKVMTLIKGAAGKTKGLFTKIASVLGIKTGAAAISLGTSELIGAGFGAIEGLDGTAKLFQINRSDVDATMRVISSVIGAFGGTLLGSIIVVCDDAIQSIFGVSVLNEIALYLYNSFAGEERYNNLISKNDEFKESYIDYQEAEIENSYEVYKQSHANDSNIISLEEYKEQVKAGDISATYDSFAEYNYDTNATVSDKVGSGIFSMFSAIGDGISDLTDKTKLSIKVDESNNVYYKKNSNDNKWIAYNISNDKEIGEVAASTISQFETQTYEKNITWGEKYSRYENTETLESLFEKDAEGNVIFFDESDQVWYFLASKNTFIGVNNSGLIVNDGATSSDVYNNLWLPGKLKQVTVDITKASFAKTFMEKGIIDAIGQTFGNIFGTNEAEFNDEIPEEVLAIYNKYHYKDGDTSKDLSIFDFEELDPKLQSLEIEAVGNVYYLSSDGKYAYIYSGDGQFIKYDVSAKKVLEDKISLSRVASLLSSGRLTRENSSSLDEEHKDLIEIFEAYHDTTRNGLNVKAKSAKDSSSSNITKRRSGIRTSAPIFNSKSTSIYETLAGFDNISNKVTTAKNDPTDNTTPNMFDEYKSYLDRKETEESTDTSTETTTRSNVKNDVPTLKNPFAVGGYGDSKSKITTKKKAEQEVTNDTVSAVASVPFYAQDDTRWSSLDYSNPNDSNDHTDMAEAGCGPAALAMATNIVGSHNKPDYYARLAMQNGYRDNTGTNWNFMMDAPTTEGLNIQQSVLPSPEFIDDQLSKGHPIVLSGMSDKDGESGYRSVFTNRGHYVTIVGKDSNNNLLVQDPRGKEYSGAFPMHQVLEESTAAWSVSHNTNENVADMNATRLLYARSKNKINMIQRSADLFTNARTGGFGSQVELGMAAVKWMLTIYMRNNYSQTHRDNVEAGINGTGSGDCSSTVRWAYMKAGGIDVGSYTGAQWNNLGVLQVVDDQNGGVPNFGALIPGDLIFYKVNGSASTVAHVEMYLGNGKQIGHGTGVGPKVSEVTHWCNGGVESRRYLRTCRVQAGRIGGITYPPDGALKASYTELTGGLNDNTSNTPAAPEDVTTTPTTDTPDSTTTTTPSDTADTNTNVPVAEPAAETPLSSGATVNKRKTTTTTALSTYNNILNNREMYFDTLGISHNPKIATSDAFSAYERHSSRVDTNNGNRLINYLAENEYTNDTSMYFPSETRSLLHQVDSNLNAINNLSYQDRSVVDILNDTGTIDISDRSQLRELYDYINYGKGAYTLGKRDVDDLTYTEEPEWLRSESVNNAIASVAEGLDPDALLRRLMSPDNVLESEQRSALIRRLKRVGTDAKAKGTELTSTRYGKVTRSLGNGIYATSSGVYVDANDNQITTGVYGQFNRTNVYNNIGGKNVTTNLVDEMNRLKDLQDKLDKGETESVLIKPDSKDKTTDDTGSDKTTDTDKDTDKKDDDTKKVSPLPDMVDTITTKYSGGFGEGKKNVNSRYHRGGFGKTNYHSLYRTLKASTPTREQRPEAVGGFGDPAALGMAAINWMLTIYMRNNYSQTHRDNVEAGINGTGSGDCSSTVRWAYIKAGGIDVGSYTGAQWNNLGVLQVVDDQNGGVPNFGALIPGDLIFYKVNGSAATVAHVEMYLGNGKQIGHGSGVGPKVSEVTHWCNGGVESRRYLRTCRVQAGRIGGITNPPANALKASYTDLVGTAPPVVDNTPAPSPSPDTGTDNATPSDTTTTVDTGSSTGAVSNGSSLTSTVTRPSRPSDMNVIGVLGNFMKRTLNRGFNGLLTGNYDTDHESTWKSSGGFGNTLNGATFVDQHAPELANVDYSDPRSSAHHSFADAGCGPAAISMALGNVGVEANPIDIAKTAKATGYRDETGTNAEFVSGYLGAKGANVVESYTPDDTFIDESLASGRSVLLSGVRDPSEDKYSSPYTSAGHYVTVVGKDGNNNYIINDPRGRSYSKKYSKSAVLQNSTGGWSIGDGFRIPGGFGERLLSKTKKKRRAKRGGFGDVAAAGMAAVKWFLTLWQHMVYYSQPDAKRYTHDQAMNGGIGYGDCSSTTRWVYLKALPGVPHIGWTQRDQCVNYAMLDILCADFQPPPWQSLIPGDLVFYYNKSNGDISHAGLYIGNNAVMDVVDNVHCPNGMAPRIVNYTDYNNGASPTNGFYRVGRIKASAFNTVAEPDPSLMKITYEQAMELARQVSPNTGGSPAPSPAPAPDDGSNPDDGSGAVVDDGSGNPDADTTGDGQPSNIGSLDDPMADASNDAAGSSTGKASDMSVIGTTSTFFKNLLNRGFNGLLTGNYDEDFDSLWGASYNSGYSSNTGSSSGANISAGDLDDSMSDDAGNDDPNAGTDTGGTPDTGNSGGNAAVAPAGGDYLGIVSQKVESGTSSSRAVGWDKGPDGGATCGTWQFTWKYCIPRFWNRYGYDKKYPLPDPSVHANRPTFQAHWLAAVDENPAQFFANEHQFTIDDYYTPARNQLISAGVDPDQHSRALQEATLADSIRNGSQQPAVNWRASSKDGNWMNGWYAQMAASVGSDGGRYTDNPTYSEVALVKQYLGHGPMAPPYRGGGGGFGEGGFGGFGGFGDAEDMEDRAIINDFEETDNNLKKLFADKKNPLTRGGYGVNRTVLLKPQQESDAVHRAKINRVIAENKARKRKGTKRKSVGGFGRPVVSTIANNNKNMYSELSKYVDNEPITYDGYAATDISAMRNKIYNNSTDATKIKEISTRLKNTIGSLPIDGNMMPNIIGETDFNKRIGSSNGLRLLEEQRKSNVILQEQLTQITNIATQLATIINIGTSTNEAIQNIPSTINLSSGGSNTNILLGGGGSSNTSTKQNSIVNDPSSDYYEKQNFSLAKKIASGSI